MKKIMIIGCPGSGKTTFALALEEAVGIKLFHLDSIWHKADKTHISREEFDERLGEILSLDSYIIDGNYSRTIERRVEACDTVILFDLPREVCLEGAVARLGKKRPDMPWFENELDPWLKNEIETFGEKNLPNIYSLLEKYKDGRNIIVFKSREDANSFIESVTRKNTDF